MKHFLNILIASVLLVGLGASALTGATAAPTSAITLALSESTARGLTFEVFIPWQQLTIESIAASGEHYLRVALPGAASTAQPGAPQLPQLTELIGVPLGVSVALKVTPGTAHTQILSGRVLPAPDLRIEEPLPAELGFAGSFPQTTLEYTPDPAFYQTDGFYPGATGSVTNDGLIRQQRVAGISLYPVQYQPLTGELTVYESLLVEVVFEGSPSIQTTETPPESPAYENLFSSQLLNYDQAQAWRGNPALKTSSESSLQTSPQEVLPWNPPDPGWRVMVREEGIYQLTYADLETADLPVDALDPRTFQMFHMGQEVAIQVLGEEDGVFDSQDALIFYGQPIRDKYTLDNPYWLTYGAANGLRMNAREVAPGAADTAPDYQALFPIEENIWYIGTLGYEEDLDHFMSNPIEEGVTWSTVIPASLVAEGPGALEFALWGYNESLISDPDREVEVRVNGSLVGTLAWNGKTWLRGSLPIPEGYLLPEVQNTLSLKVLTNAFHAPYVYVDYLNLTYTSLFTAREDHLVFDYDLSAASTFQVSDFSSADLALLDVSDPLAPEVLTGLSVSPEASPYTLTFTETPTEPGRHRYWAASTGSFSSPWSIERDTSSDLGSDQNAADYLVITPLEFETQAVQLAGFRQAQGLRTAVVGVQDIYDQFGYGKAGSQPIKNFLAWTYAHWVAPAPAFVVLLGDGHYNPKGYNPSQYGLLRPNPIPPYLAPADYSGMETAADNRYVAFVGEDTLPDMMLGRLAVSSPEQAAAFISKIIAWETTPAAGDWQQQVMVVADNPDEGGNFPASAQTLISCCLPDRVTPERIYLGSTYANVTDARAALLAGFNDGRFLINYLGHGGTMTWSSEAGFTAPAGYLFSVYHMPEVLNPNKYPIISAMTCNEGYYINPHPVGTINREALAEVVTRADQKGAVASWSSTGKGLSSGHDPLNQALFRAIFSEMVQTLGTATNSAKLALWGTGSNLDLLDTYLLFGDPAARLPHTQLYPNWYFPLILR